MRVVAGREVATSGTKNSKVPALPLRAEVLPATWHVATLDTPREAAAGGMRLGRWPWPDRRWMRQVRTG